MRCSKTPRLLFFYPIHSKKEWKTSLGHLTKGTNTWPESQSIETISSRRWHVPAAMDGHRTFFFKL